MTRIRLALIALTIASPLHARQHGPLSGTIKIDGSSTVYLITEAIAEEFKTSAPAVNVTVGISGTGGGFKRFSAGETDCSNASRPIKPEENERAASNAIEYIELPVAYDGLSIVVNTKNTWVDHLTLDEVKRIWTDGSTVRTWRDVRPAWPDQPIRIFSPGTDSGTFDYFKEVVVGSKGAVRGDMSVSEDDNVLVKGITGDVNAIGFFGCAYYFENKASLKIVPIDAGKGPITPTHDTIESGAYAPFSRPLFLYVNRKALERTEIKAFITFYLQNAGKTAESVGYVKLPAPIYARAAKNVASKKTGTQFLTPEGSPRHGTLTDLYK
jgi:phosphate transport system substrate-binding protein